MLHFSRLIWSLVEIGGRKVLCMIKKDCWEIEQHTIYEVKLTPLPGKTKFL